MPENKYLTFARFVLVACLVFAGTGLLGYLIWYAADLLLLVFSGVLVAVLLRGISRYISLKTGLGQSPSLALVTIVLIGAILAAGWLVAGRIGTQATEIQQAIPKASESISQYINQHEWSREAFGRMPSLDEWLSGRSGEIISRITNLASTAFGAILNTVVVFIIGLYFAFQPELYSRGVKHLLPFRFRKRGGEVLQKLDDALWRWLGGRFLLMSVNGLLTGLGLWMFGMPLALTLGLFAGLLNFIPNFGPWLAAAPAVLIAFLESPEQALYVAILYLTLQSLDGYVFTPIIDRKTVEIPPVLTITAQILFGAAFGLLGLLLASPMVAVLMILVKMLYVEDVIGDPVMENDEKNSNGGSA